MSWFQILALSALGMLVLSDLLTVPSARGSRLLKLSRMGVWLAAGVAIAIPDIIQRLARLVGIDRGADLVLYLFILTFLWVSFYFYSRYVRLQRQLTELVRQMALRGACEGHPRGGSGMPG
jgi:small membrane protein